MTTPRMGGGEMFDAIAPRYDLLNHVLSFGLDPIWRRRAVAALDLAPDARALDVAFGTGDQAAAILRAAPGARVVGLDPSRGMLERGREKLGGRIQVLMGDAERLPFPDGTFDAVTIAFGIRNVPDRPQGLREMARVLRRGGRLAVVELGTPRGRVLGRAARWWVAEGVPRVGRLLTGSKAYGYLQSSVLAFPEPEIFGRMMREAGLEVREVRPMTFGGCTLYVGERV